MAEWPPLFDSNKCPEAVADKVDFLFISDCTILPAPEPVFDCPDIEIPPDPPVPIVPCPTFKAGSSNSVTTTGSIQAVFGNQSASGQSACKNKFDVTGAIDLIFTEGDCCDFVYDLALDLDFDVKLCIPDPPCPAFGITASGTIQTAFSSGGSAPCKAQPNVNIDVMVTKNSGSSFGDCDYTFDFAFDFSIPPPPIPCPAINASATATANGGGNSGSAPCGGEPAVDLVLTVTTEVGSDSCNPDCAVDFDFDFNFIIPKPQIPCPAINASGTATATATNTNSAGGSVLCGGQPGVDVTLEITTGTTQGSDACDPSCELDIDFAFDFAFQIPQQPIPCPTITGQALALANGGSNSGTAPCGGEPTAEVALTITPTAGSDSCNPECEFDFAFLFDFVIPKPVIPCPNIGGTATATATAGFTLPSNSSGSATATCGGQPNVNVTVDLTTNTTAGSDSCNPSCNIDFDFDFGFDFTIPTPPIPCPVITGNAVAAVAVSSSGDGCWSPAAAVALTVTTEAGSDSCNPDCSVDFDFSFDFTIPEPPTTCPTVNGTATATVNGGTGSLSNSAPVPCTGNPTAAVTLEVTQTTEGDSCNPECQIDFDFAFDFTIPKQQVACPNIDVTAGMTITGGGGSLSADAGCGWAPTGDVTVTMEQVTGGDSCNPSCDYSIDFDFNFDLPAPPATCPNLNFTAGMTVAGGTAGSNPSDPGTSNQCWRPTGDVTVTVESTNTSCGQSCDYDIDFDFNLNIPTPPTVCPAINASAGGTVAVATGAVPDVAISVETTITEGSSCDAPCDITFDFNFDFTLPLPSQSSGQSAEAEFVTEITGASIGSDCALVIAYNTGKINYKQAIVPTASGMPVGLHCIESPEVWFFDVVRLQTDEREVVLPLDPTFLEVCEPYSVSLLAVSTQNITAHGGSVIGGALHCEFDRPPGEIVATVGGIRKGAAGRRFPKHTPDEMERNNEFWRV